MGESTAFLNAARPGFFPSPLVGEGGRGTRPDEGDFSPGACADSPSPDPRIRSDHPLPRGERGNPADVQRLTSSSETFAAEKTLPLLAWLTPSFPVGAYAYSHGLEWAVETGEVRNETTVLAWVTDILRHGAGRNDALFMLEAVKALAADDMHRLAEANELALAYAPSRELLLETGQQGRSFLDAVREAWPAPRLLEAAAALTGEVAYPVAVGAAVAAHGIDPDAAAASYLLAFAQNLVSAAVRLGAIGQTAGTRVVAHLAPIVADLAVEARTLTLDDLGSATFRADLGSFLHETQYTRLFRS